MAWLKGWVSRLGMPWLVVSSAACQDATQVTLDIRTDIPCQAGGDDAPFGSAAMFAVPASEVLSPDGLAGPNAITSRCLDSTPVNDVGTLAIIPSDGVDGRFGVRIHVGVGSQSGESCAQTPCGDDECIDLRRRVSFVPQRSLRLPIVASRNCLGVCCGDEDTCVNGECVPIDTAGCDASVEDCDPPVPDPPVPPSPEGPLLGGASFDLNGAALDLTAAALRQAPTGPILAVGGTYQTAGDRQPTIGDITLPLSTTQSAFYATFEPTFTAERGLRLTSMTRCTGPELAVDDVALSDEQVMVAMHAVGQGMVRCDRLDADSLPPDTATSLGAESFIAVTEPAAPTAALEVNKLSVNLLGGTARIQGLAARANATEVAGIYFPGQNPFVPGGNALSPNAEPGFWQVVRSQGSVTVGGFFSHPQPLLHSITFEPSTGTTWRVGLREEDGDRVLSATPNSDEDGAFDIVGEISVVNRPRRVAGTRGLIVPIEILGQVDLGPDAPGGVALRLNHPNDGSSNDVEVLKFVAGASEVHAGGTANRWCMVYRQNAESQLDCDGLDPFNLGAATGVNAFDMDRVTPSGGAEVDGVLLAGRHTGSVDAIGLAADDEGDRFYVALVGLP